MSDFDRYDFALSIVAGLIAVGALALYPHFWIAFVVLLVVVAIVLNRHDLLRPKRTGGPPEHRGAP